MRLRWRQRLAAYARSVRPPFRAPTVQRCENVARGYFVWLIVAAQFGCMVSVEEVLRVSSPTDNVDAVVAEINGGATTSYAYKLYVVASGEPMPKDGEIATLYGAIDRQCAYGFDVRWTASDSLELTYFKARFTIPDTLEYSAHARINGTIGRVFHIVHKRVTTDPYSQCRKTTYSNSASR